MAWTPFTVAAPTGAALSDDAVTYGPCIPREDTLRLLGDVAGKRVLDLGCGAGTNAVALARAGARTIAVDESAEQIGHARAAVDAADLRVELHHASLAELAFLRADTIDAAISVGSLAHVADMGRVFRQIHRVLRTEHTFVLALPHPAFTQLDPGQDEGLAVRHSAFDLQPFPEDDPRAGTFNRSTSTIFVELGRAGFRVDTLLEPAPTDQGGPHWSPAMAKVPATLILRARKEGI
ncbi:class I SAM-dependent methyltransferase [Actinospongicola halichondriae]|uniref:class I SAM-dependent methyltransferase n=1 Tax=Actinospongicola halichondriae TaxID=3236844 RepID=UPI003D545D55